MPAVPDLILGRFGVDDAPAWVERLVAIYLDVYGDPVDAFHGEERYRRQLCGHLTAPGWEAVTATVAGDLVGYAYGFALGPQTRWWNGLLTEAPPDFTVENGRRTFALSEILVRAGWRRRGVGRALHDALLAGRGERRATLLVDPANAAARAAYASWGWHGAGRLRPGWPHAPVFEVLMRALSGPVADFSGH